MQTLLINPSRRKRSKKRRSSARRGKRRMSALQRKYFGGGRKRRASRTITVRANPSRRRRSSKRRSYRRNPSARAMSLPSMSGITGNFTRAAGVAVKGAVGAVAVDVAMGQAAGFLPVSMTSRYNAEGGINPAYYATKAALAVGLGMLGARVLPGRAKDWAAQGVVGSMTVMGYEVLRNVLPPSITLGAYLNPARVVSGGMGRVGRIGRVAGRGMGAYLTRNSMGRMGASYPAGSSHPAGSSDARIGEASVI